ncbi:MAG TPA: competence/damage-inducible protein A [Candidatus Eisenbacteria bacterium]|nr:competence/damage-inducible protein A [Candidatus Eisenbacteria bacterium]
MPTHPTHQASWVTARLVIVGDEVLSGEVVDQNGPLLLSRLAARGLRVSSLSVLPDALEPLAIAIREQSRAADWVFVTGGIGPTHDDCTRQAVAAALERPLAIHPVARERLEAIFRRGATPEEWDMSLLPVGAEILDAPDIVAFGFSVANVIVFPGVPKLLEPLMLANQHRWSGRPWHRREIETTLREGLVAAPLAALAAAWPDLRWGSYPELGEKGWRLRLVLRGEDPERLDAAYASLAEILARLRSGNA